MGFLWWHLIHWICNTSIICDGPKFNIEEIYNIYLCIIFLLLVNNTCNTWYLYYYCTWLAQLLHAICTNIAHDLDNYIMVLMSSLASSPISIVRFSQFLFSHSYLYLLLILLPCPHQHQRPHPIPPGTVQATHQTAMTTALFGGRGSME